MMPIIGAIPSHYFPLIFAGTAPLSSGCLIMSSGITCLNKSKDGLRMFIFSSIHFDQRIMICYMNLIVCFPVLQRYVFKIKMAFELEISHWILKNQKRKVSHNEYNTVNTNWWYILVWLCIYTCVHSDMHMNLYIYIYIYIYIYMSVYSYMCAILDLECFLLIQKTNAIIFHIRCLSLNMLFFVLFITCFIKCF